MKEKRVENSIFIIFVIIGSIFFAIGIFFSINILSNNENIIDTKGTITQIATHRDSDGDTKYDVYVAYNIDGKKYESRLNGYISGYYKGKEIDIYYYKDDPGRIGTHTLDKLLLIFPVTGLIFLLIGLWQLIRKANKKKIVERLKENGDVIYATYIETTINRNYSVNGRHPYNIICEWNNQNDGKKYLFRSENIWVNPEETIKQMNLNTFKVYINMSNMKQYVIDVADIVENIVDLR